MRPHPWLVVVLVGSAIGLVFAGVSTYDFVQHLDRQVHSLHCSFIPGMGHETGESGCQVAMMSQYSSVFRSRVWGGIPISLPAMAVFAFIGFYTIDLLVTRRKHDPKATAFLALATCLPAITSIIMLVISLSKLGTTCKLCVCIYTASALCLTGAIVSWRRAVRTRGAGEPIAMKPKPKPVRREERSEDPAWTGAQEVERQETRKPQLLVVEVESPPASLGFLGAAFAIGVTFVVVPVVLYLALAPDHGKFVGTCDSLAKPDDAYGVMVPIGPTRHSADAAPAIEIFDPLCPACRAFEERLTSSSFDDQLDRKAVLFPLDNTCNWMVTEATHPGACTISEAVLCAQSLNKGEVSSARAVIEWAFSEQERIRDETRADPTAAARLVKARFPDLAACVGSADAKSRLNKSLRWAVNNNIRVLTPQLFVDNVKLCDEDVDLGLDYSLKTMLERHANHTLAGKPLEAPAAAKPMDPDPHAKPNDKPNDKPGADKPTDKASDKPADKPADKPKDKPSTEPASDKPSTDKPKDKPADKPADKPTDKPADKPTDKPADKPTDKPADKPTDKPADKPADKPVTSPSESGGAP